jgi:hypothetical protein
VQLQAYLVEILKVTSKGQQSNVLELMVVCYKKPNVLEKAILAFD